MNILITGEPRSGKSTLLAKIVEKLPNKQGFLTREMLEDGQRVGFELVSSIGATATLAHINSKSRIRISKYGVNVDVLENFIDALPPIEEENLLYIDEIGQMELFSDKFKKLTLDYLAANNPFLGTLTSVYDDEFAARVRKHKGIEIIRLTPDNRESVEKTLATRLIKS